MPNLSRCERLSQFFFSPEERPNLTAELEMAAELVEGVFRSDLTSYQRDALICLVADIYSGFSQSQTRGDFLESNLIKLVNGGMNQLAAVEFFKFAYLNGRVDRRLWAKRDCEQILFRRGSLQLKDEV